MKRTLLLSLSAGVIYLTLTSAGLGASTTPIGHQASQVGCGGGGCHGTTASTATTIVVGLLDQSDNSVVIAGGKYRPNQKYTVTVVGSNAAAAKFGYMIRFKDASNTQAGVFSNPSAGSKISTSSPYQVVEHSGPITKIAIGFTASFEWTAPAKGKGVITINAAINGVNAVSGADTGDKYNVATLTLNEGFPASVNDIDNTIAVNAYPNPATNVLNIEVENTSASYNYAIFNMNGSVSTQGNFRSKTSIDVSALATGVHFVKITDGTNEKTIIFNKL